MPALTFEQILAKSETPTGCGVIVVRNGKILAGTRIERAGLGKLCGPGGHIEPGESPEEAAKRETREEFGIVCNELMPLGTLTMGARHGKSAVFLCSSFSGEPKTDEKEMTQPKWIRASEITSEDAYPPFYQSLQLMQEKKPVAKTIKDILKFNENHDRLGRFSSAAGGTGAGAGSTSRKISEYSTDAYDDQVDMRMESHDGDSLAGYMEYSVYDGVPSIQYIHTEDGFQRQGVATEMLQRLQSQFPGTEIEWGMTTPDGTKLKEKLTYEVRDKKVERQQKKLQSMKEEISRNEAEMNDLWDKVADRDFTEPERKRMQELGGQWDKLNSKIRDLTEDLEGKKVVKYMIKMPGDTKKSAGSADFEIFKADEDKHLVFGWASIVVTVNGEELEDRQHDMIDPEDLEDAAYEYVLNFRDTGEEHLPGYRKKGKLVESCVLTKEKQKAMGIPEGILPVGWWIGFKIDDEDTWQRVKNGTYKMFSIEGKAQREPVEKAQRNFKDFPGYWEWLEENLDSSLDDQKAAQKFYGGKTHKTIAKSFLDILKFNPYHDALGRFTGSGGGAGGPVAFFTNRTKDPAKQHWADKARLREQERQTKILEGKVKDALDHANAVATDPKSTFEDVDRAVSEWNKLSLELEATKKPLNIKSPEKQEPKKPETAPKEYKTPTRSEAHEMAKEMGNSRSDISPEDYEIMAGENNWGGRYFQSSHSFHLNEALRKAPDGNLSSLSDSDRKLVETLDRNMKPSTRDIKVTRMVGDSFLRDQLGLKLDNEGNVDANSLKNAAGKVTVCKAYSSTSFDMGENVFTSRNVKLNINAPKGSKMLVSPTGEEAEILLARNTAFHVKGIRQTGMKWGEPQYEIDVDILVD